MKSYVVAASLIFLSSACVVSAADLLERVRADAGLCVVIDDLPAHIEELTNSQLHKRLESIQLYQKWQQGSDVRKLTETLSQLQDILGTPIPESLLNLMGEQAIVAVYPQAEGGPAGVLMTKPGDYEQAERLLDLWHLIENAEVTQLNGRYWKRSTHKNTLYYLLDKDFFALSDREVVIRNLSKSTTDEKRSGLLQQSSWKQGITQASPESWIRVWFRPELWKGVVQLPEVGGPQGVLLDQLKRADHLLLELDTKDGLHSALHLTYKSGQNPELLMAYHEQYPPKPGILDAISPVTMSIMTGRGGLGFVGNLIDRRLAQERDQEQEYFRELLTGLLFDKDPYRDVLPALGAEWMIETRRGASQSNHPVDLLIRTSLDDRRDQAVTLQQSLQNLLRSGLNFLAVSENGSSDDVMSDALSQGDRVYRYQSKRGWQPSFVVTNSHLLIASDEERVRQAVLEADESLAGSQFQALKDRKLANSQLGVMVDFGIVREVIQDPSPELFKRLNIPPAKQQAIGQSLAVAADTLKLFDGAYSFWQSSDVGWSLYLGATLVNE
jgi:hypothetical protein